MKSNSQVKCFLMFVACCLLAELGYGQVKTNVTFSNPYFTGAKKAYKTQKEYRRYLKDSIRSIKRLNKHYDSKIDSLSSQIERESVDRQQTQKFIDQRINFEGNPVVDPSYEVSLNEASNPYVDKLDSTYSTTPDSIALHTKDSVQYFQKQLEQQLEAQVASTTGINKLVTHQNSLTTTQEQLNQYKSSFNQYRDKKNLKNNLKELSESQLIKQNETLNQANQTVKQFKTKYLTLPSSNDLSTATTLNSLKGQPLRKRLIFGGNIKITQAKLTSVDLSPSVAYLVSKKLSFGIETIYRTQFGTGQKWQETFKTETYGGRLFVDYAVVRSFYAHGELELISTPETAVVDKGSKQVIPGALFGIGKRFGIGSRVDGKVIFQYNFLHSGSELYTSPWVLRFGIEIKKKE